MRRRTSANTVRWRGLFCFCATLLLALIISGTSIAEEVTIDNGDSGTSSTGSWSVSGGSDPYGANSLYSKDAGSTYTFETALSGLYDVFFRWTGWSSRCTAVPVEIYDGDNLLDTLDVNQQENASQWYLLGTYTFSGTARILVRAVGSSCSTCVDAVRFVSGVPAELGYIEIEGPPEVVENTSATYVCRAYYTNGTDHIVDTDTWAIDPPTANATISSSGILTADEVESDEFCQVMVSYTEGDITRNASHPVTILDFVSPPEVTIDNGDPGTSSTGSWRVSGGSDPYGADSLYSKDAGSTYTFEAALSGPYDVFFRWTGWSSRCTAVPVEIYDGDNLLDTLDVNQQENASEWYLLGTYSFTGTARVRITAVGSICSTCVDAVRFVSGVPAELDHIEIEGPPEVVENTGATYVCRAYYTNGTDHIVDTDTWAIDPPTANATISSSGILTAGEVESDEFCHVMVSYTEGEVTDTDSYDVIITNYVPPELDHIEIEGPPEVVENTGATYVCRAYYINGTDHIVDTDTWAIDPPTANATISSSGILTAGEVESDEFCQVMVSYTEGDVIRNASHPVTILDVVSPPEVTIDNGDPGTSYTGIWPVSGGSYPFGDDSLYSKDAGSTYTFETALSGPYDVFFRWTGWSSRCTAVPVEIYDGDNLLDTLDVNQQENASQWYLLGTYTFSGTARILVRAVGSSCSTCVDAVRFVSGVPAELGYIKIEGPSEVMENTSATYVCRAYYTNGTDHIVDTDTWAIDPPSPYAEISSSGVLTAGEVESDEPCRVTVSYTEGDVTDTDSYDVIITNYVSPELDYIKIEGPSEVMENSSATYVCRAYYTNGTDHIVDTDTWAIDPPTVNATISSSGILTAGEVESDEFCQVMVSYTEGDVTRNASHPVTILDFVSPPEVTIDNGDPGTSSTGSWSVSGGSDPYGKDSLYSKDAGSTYTFEAALSGPYDVFFRWTGWSSRCTSVPVEIYDGDNLLDTLDVNQQENASQWYLLGTYTFTGTARVRVLAVGSICSTCVDAVRFVSGLPPELEYIEIEGPGQFLENTSVTYLCRAYYNNGTDQIVDTTTWSLDPPSPYAEISPFGVLTADEVDSDQPCNINVSYTEGGVTRTSERKVIIKDFTGPTMENIYVCVGYNAQFVKSKENMIEMLQDIGATEVGDGWVYVNESIARTHYIYFVEDIGGMKQALMEEGAHVIFTGHSNYGHGPSFASGRETSLQIIEDILYVDDPRIFNVSTEWINVSLRGMRTGQAYPYYWCKYQDGTDAKMPYDLGDFAGDPPYNYYLTYQVAGDPTHHKIETVRRSAVARFTYSVPPWYSPTGEEPDAGDPDHMQYYITNPEPWYPSFETEGNWEERYQETGFFKENYMRTPPGDGSDVAKFMFRIPEAGLYKLFAWYPAFSNNTNHAPYTVNHASGNSTVATVVIMNQRINGGQWNELGEFDFNAQEYSVDLSNAVSSGNVMADGVRVAHIDNPPEIVRANFYARPLNGTAPLDVYFRNISTGDFTDREWDFGDGFTNQTRDSITNTYTKPGIYTVRLTVSGPTGSDTVTRSALIWVDQPETPLKAEFSASNRTGIYPLEVRFRDRSAGNITSWYWDFGDGTNSTEPDPTHEYTFPWIYTVSLTVSDSGTAETSTETKEDLVYVGIYDNNIDNVDYPKVHYSSKTILRRKELEIQPEEMGYTRMLYDSCNSGNYFLGTFHRGKTFYTLANSQTIAAPAYLRAYLEWKNDEKIWQTIQEIQPVYDYYDFTKLPEEQ